MGQHSRLALQSCGRWPGTARESLEICTLPVSVAFEEQRLGLPRSNPGSVASLGKLLPPGALSSLIRRWKQHGLIALLGGLNGVLHVRGYLLFSAPPGLANLGHGKRGQGASGVWASVVTVGLGGTSASAQRAHPATCCLVQMGRRACSNRSPWKPNLFGRQPSTELEAGSLPQTAACAV